MIDKIQFLLSEYSRFFRESMLFYWVKVDKLHLSHETHCQNVKDDTCPLLRGIKN